MSKIFGYGEDAFTLWALKYRVLSILKKFQDKTAPSDCLVFYRPSFGRSGGEESAGFGEFDAILVSQKNVYLIESKWDNLSSSSSIQNILRPVQELRHRIFSWYMSQWQKKYHDHWDNFVSEHKSEFEKTFRKPIAPAGSLLARNLEFILSQSQAHCSSLSAENNIKNVLLFFYNKEQTDPSSNISGDFNLVSIDYSQNVTGNFIRI
jgi:hypothetical protein